MEALRVLVVDDEEELVSTLVERLKLRGIDAQGAITGAEALSFIESNGFDVAVVDVKMPGIGGLELMERLRAKRPDLQVILLTGRGSEKESEMGLEAGAFAYLMKPIDIEELVKMMRDAAKGLKGNA
jgi:DNA-binding response OmpR family regulator